MPTPVGDCKEAVVKMPFGSCGIFLTSHDHQVSPDPFRKTEHPWCKSHCRGSEDLFLQVRVLWVGTNEEGAATPAVTIPVSLEGLFQDLPQPQFSPRIPKPSLYLPSLGKQFA